MLNHQRLQLRPAGGTRSAHRLCTSPHKPAPASGRPQRRHRLRAAEPREADPEDEEEFDGLLPEEDVEVPGTYFDALNGNTKLGKAVRAACDELEHLGNLEEDVLQQCDVLLKKLGMKGSLLGGSNSGGGSSAAPDSGSSDAGGVDEGALAGSAGGSGSSSSPPAT